MKQPLNRAKAVITSDDSVRELLEMLRNVPKEAAASLLKGANQGAQILLGLAIKERFTGKGPFPVVRKRLGVRSGRLRRSLRATKAKVARGVVSLSMGSNVRYFATHEFGRKGQERVKAHNVKKHRVRNAFGSGKTLTRQASYRQAHLRNANHRARQPLQAAIRQHAVRVFGVSIEQALIRRIEGRIS